MDASSLFPLISLCGSFLIAVAALVSDDPEARQAGLNYAGSVLAISGTAYQVHTRNKDDNEETPPNSDPITKPTQNHNPDEFI